MNISYCLENPDLLSVFGSKLYGTSTESSDTDLRGFIVPDAQYLLGRERWDQCESLDKNKGEDTVIWNFQKFFHLLEKNSPNVLEIIFSPKESIVKITPSGQKMIDNKHLFLSKRTISPMQAFSYSEYKKAFEYLPKIDKIGDQRKSHIEDYGYCVKSAYHAIRLIEQCLEIIRTGTLVFPRENASFLKKVRYGEVSAQKAKEYYKKIDSTVKEELLSCDLPDYTDKVSLDNLYYTIIGDKIVKFKNEYKIN